MIRVSLALLAALLAACTPKAPLVVQSAALQQPAATVLPLPAGCGLWLGALEDKREAASNTGPTNRTIDLGDFPGAVRGQLLALGLAPSGSDPAGRVQVELLHAYIGGAGTMKAGNVALRIQVGARPPVIARGNRTSLNWNSSDKELSGAIAGALADAMAGARANLLAQCLAH